MKKNHLLQLMYGVLILVVIITTAQSCNTFRTWFGTGGDFDRKHVRAERKALREQMEEDDLWGGDDEYNPWEENNEYDRDRW